MSLPAANFVAYVDVIGLCRAPHTTHAPPIQVCSRLLLSALNLGQLTLYPPPGLVFCDLSPDSVIEPTPGPMKYTGYQQGLCATTIASGSVSQILPLQNEPDTSPDPLSDLQHDVYCVASANSAGLYIAYYTHPDTDVYGTPCSADNPCNPGFFCGLGKSLRDACCHSINTVKLHLPGLQATQIIIASSLAHAIQQRRPGNLVCHH